MRGAPFYCFEVYCFEAVRLTAIHKSLRDKGVGLDFTLPVEADSRLVFG